MEAKLKERIEQLIHSKRIFLFMKGNPDAPQCGFSANVAGILHTLHADFGSFDILSDDVMRQGVKEFSNWPTFPQLYIDGELVGRSDIVTEMYHSGELKKMLEKKPSVL